MSYRSLKRVLGESNLERKCRWLFGICLTFLIFIAFWGVDRIGEDLVMSNAHRSGAEGVRHFLINKHWDTWETKPAVNELRKELTRNLLHDSALVADVLSLDRALVASSRQVEDNELSDGREKVAQRIVGPKDDREEALLRSLRDEFDAQMAKMNASLQANANPGGDKSKNADGKNGTAAWDDDQPFEPAFRSQRVQQEGKFYYYQPVYWNEKFCSTCHDGLYGKFAISAADTSLASSNKLPFLVVRVSRPDKDVRNPIDMTRAVLLTVGILTVSVSMVALWLVVRYVVVKPLSHLRDVSESIATGDLDVRADIHTSDEFEELASSFNKMLRHLMDAQGELRTVNHDLDAKVDQLAQLNMRLHEMNRLKGEFLANMSHELRTPLNSIIGFSEVLQGIDSLTDKQKRYAQNIQKSGRLLLDMINDILDLAKMEAGKMEVRPSEFSIDTIIQAQCDLVRALAEDKNIDLMAEIEDPLPTLYQDQGKVQQILTNLLSNAIKFTPEGGRIFVSASAANDEMLEMCVVDTGVGIAEADREIIFEKFRQGTTVLGQDNLTREYSGTGLGLSIVKELCKLLGGEIFVESDLGKGSTFRVFLPWSCVERPQAASKLLSKLDDLGGRNRRSDAEGGSSLAAGLSSARYLPE